MDPMIKLSNERDLTKNDFKQAPAALNPGPEAEKLMKAWQEQQPRKVSHRLLRAMMTNYKEAVVFCILAKLVPVFLGMLSPFIYAYVNDFIMDPEDSWQDGLFPIAIYLAFS